MSQYQGDLLRIKVNQNWLFSTETQELLDDNTVLYCNIPRLFKSEEDFENANKLGNNATRSLWWCLIVFAVFKILFGSDFAFIWIAFYAVQLAVAVKKIRISTGKSKEIQLPAPVDLSL